MASYAYSKQWKGKDGQDYFLWSGADNLKPYYGEPVYSYNQVMDMLKAARKGLNYGDDGDEKLYKAVYKKLYGTRENLDRVGISYDEPLFTEAQVYGLKNPIFMALGRDGSNNGRSEAELIQNMANKFGLSIMTKDEWTAYTRPDKVTQFLKYALPAAGLTLATAGIGGFLGGVDAAGNAVAGSLWSPTGAAVAGDAVATASPVALTSAEGITASPLAPLAGTGGGAATGGLVTASEAASAASGGGILKGLGGAVSGLGSLLAPAANAILGTIGYQNNKDAYNDAYNAQKDYLDKMLGLVDEQRQNNEQRYQQARQDVIDYYQQARGDAQPYYNAGIGGLDALGNYYGNSANVWGALGNLAGVNGREGQQAAINMIENSPAFEAMVKQGENAILQNAAATGGLRGGNTQYALAQFRPQILSGLMDKQYNQLSGMANQGMSAANSAASIGGNAMNSLINASIHTGQTLGDMGVRAGNTDAGFLTNMMNIYGKMSDAEKNLILAQAQNRNARNSGYGNAIGQAIGALPSFINGIKGLFG